MIMEMLNTITDFNQVLPEFIETTIPCENCDHGYVEYEPRPYERNYQPTGLCPVCRGRMEVEVMRCSICGKDENTCACYVAAKEIAA